MLCIFAATACNSKSDKGKMVARAYGDYLYEDDISEVLPLEMAPHDSAIFAQEYIRKWIEQKIFEYKAEKTLSRKEKKMDEELENYRRSLIAFAYQNKVLESSLDTKVSIDEVQQYYDQNREQFQLKNNILKVQFVRILKDNPNVEQIQKYIFSDKLSSDELKKLQKLCEENAVNYFLDTDKWLLFNELLKGIPFETYDQEEFLRHNRMFQVPDGNEIYFVHIYDFRIKESPSPLNFEQQKITSIILNQRKEKLLENLREELVKEATDKKEFEIY